MSGVPGCRPQFHLLRFWTTDCDFSNGLLNVALGNCASSSFCKTCIRLHAKVIPTVFEVHLYYCRNSDRPICSVEGRKILGGPYPL